MDSKASVLVFLGLVLVFACLALGNLVEIAPEALPPHHEIPMPALMIETARITASTGEVSSPSQRFFSLLKPPPDDGPLPMERDQNGLPLDLGIYRRVAYQKFPPEGFHG